MGLSAHRDRDGPSAMLRRDFIGVITFAKGGLYFP
jgi:hypothetical protein